MGAPAASLGVLSGAALAGLAAQASGFGVYLLASSTVGAITAGLGTTLPFGFYLALSSAIHIIIGPAGWIALVIAAVLQLTGPDWQRVSATNRL
jgi:hypothetical protein